MGAKKLKYDEMHNEMASYREPGFDEYETTEFFDDSVMIGPKDYEVLLNHLNASAPRKALRVKMRLPALISGHHLFVTVNILSLSLKGMGIDKKISNKYGESCYVTIPTDPPLMLRCCPIVGSKEFESGSWDRLEILTKFSLERAVPLLYAAFIRETKKK